jgi:hypothetical protein
MEQSKIYGWFSQKHMMKKIKMEAKSCTHYYEDINGKTVHVTHISHDPNNSNTMYDDIVFVGELKRFLHN